MWVCMVVHMLHDMTWWSTKYMYHNDYVVMLTTVCFSAPSCLYNNGIVSVLLFHIIWQWLLVACSLFFLTLAIVVLFFHLCLRVCALLVLFFGNAPGNIGSAPVFCPVVFYTLLVLSYNMNYLLSMAHECAVNSFHCLDTLVLALLRSWCFSSFLFVFHLIYFSPACLSSFLDNRHHG
jgi:hypothetical protein